MIPISNMQAKCDKASLIGNLFQSSLWLLLTALILTACSPFSTSIETSARPTAEPQHNPASTSTISEPSKGMDLPKSDGPLLLIQTEVDAYQILDLENQTATPFLPPGGNQQYDLAKNLSPSGSEMLFPLSQDEVLVLSFQTGLVHTNYNLKSDPPVFQLEATAQATRRALPDLPYSEEALLEAVQDALVRSKLNITWFGSDRYHLIVVEGTETSTYLALDDHQTGTREQLEAAPALVEDYWVSPDETDILLKKGFVFESGIWGDDRYYIVDSQERTAAPIPLPEGVHNPAVSWLSPQFIGVTHQTQPAGGINFSAYNTLTRETTRVIEGAFTSVHLMGEDFLVIRHDSEESALEIRTLTGELVLETTIDDRCAYFTQISDHILLNCQAQSLLLSKTLETSSFGEPIIILSRAPGGGHIILMDRSESIRLLDDALQTQASLTLDSPPLEIRWLPDATGFPYRTPGSLYQYDLATRTSRLLLTSDLWSDYRNLNAVWIKTSE